MNAETLDKTMLDLFLKKAALLEGHFLLSSGLHSDRYLQSALVLQDTAVAQELGRKLISLFSGVHPDTVVSPAIGGLIIGHETARAAGARAIFSEKDSDGKPVLRRGFELKPGEKVLVVEDVITTGLSTGEVVELVLKAGAEFLGIGSIVNRTGFPSPAKAGKLAGYNKPVRSLLNLDVKSWAAAECPLCKQGIPAVKPGSRKTG